MWRKFFTGILLFALCCVGVRAQQLYRGAASPTVSIPLTVTVANRLTLSSLASGPILVSESDGRREISVPVSLEWNLNPNVVSQVRLNAYLDGPEATPTTPRDAATSKTAMPFFSYATPVSRGRERGETLEIKLPRNAERSREEHVLHIRAMVN
jgi:hypothetical protein